MMPPSAPTPMPASSTAAALAIERNTSEPGSIAPANQVAARPRTARHDFTKEQTQKSRLAGAARAGKEHELPFVDVHREVAQGVDAAAVEL